VYEATDRSLERRVAVKVIREDWLYSADAAQRFQREARAAAAFAHPNVVTVHDFGIEAGTRAFLVMELLQGVAPARRDQVSSAAHGCSHRRDLPRRLQCRGSGAPPPPHPPRSEA